jgi:hypothetical protein
MPGGAAIAYTLQSGNGVDMVAAFYDETLDVWSLPRQLTHDEASESGLSLTCDNDDLLIAYLKTQTLRENVDVEIEGQVYQVEDIPQPGRTDLYIMRHSIGWDVAVVTNSLAVSPANPAPGASATVTGTIENMGDLVAQDLEIALYDGDPSLGGVEIGRLPLTSDLGAGHTELVEFTWNVPDTLSPHRLVMVADPDMTLEDRDRSNNNEAIWAVLPDLAVVTGQNEKAGKSSVTLTTRLENKGVIPNGAFEVSWRLGNSEGEEIGRSQVPGLLVGSTYDCIIEWMPGRTSANGNFAAVVSVIDPDRTCIELTRDNNMGTQTIPMGSNKMPTLPALQLLLGN